MKNIAFLTSGIMDYLSSDAWNGIKNAARNDDVNLITVPLKYIARDLNGLPDRYEYQYEIRRFTPGIKNNTAQKKRSIAKSRGQYIVDREKDRYEPE